MAPELDPLALFVAPLERLGVPYAVTGSFATIAYGAPRMTTDIDIIVALAPEDANRFAEAFSLGELYVPPVETLAAEFSRSSGGHFNLVHPASELRADVYPAGADRLNAWALSGRRRLSVGGRLVWFASPEYVIVRKLEYASSGGGSKHLEDIRAVLARSADRLDLETIERVVREQGLEATWRLARGAG